MSSSSSSAAEAKKHIEKLSKEDLNTIMTQAVVMEPTSAVEARIEKHSTATAIAISSQQQSQSQSQSQQQQQQGGKAVPVAVPICSYECTANECNFDELLSWVSKYHNSLVADMIDDETKNIAATAVCEQVSKHMDVIKPRNHQGYYFHHHNTPILRLQNKELPHEIYTQGRRDEVAVIDVENLVFYSVKAMKKGMMTDYLSSMKVTSTWQELAINMGAAALGISSVVLAFRGKKRSPGGVSPMLLGALSVGMFGLNRYGQQQKLKRTEK
jgi:hypothetical protein